MILTGPQICREVSQNRIHIEPFDLQCVNPNSYNYHLSDTLIHVTSLDLDDNNRSIGDVIHIPPDGFVLVPGELYLGSTVEKIGSVFYTTSLIGRSSMGRLGLFLQISANLGHQTILHQWTLEIRCCLPLRVFPNQIIGQVSFWEPVGARRNYEGFYGTCNEPTPSKGVERL